ncbi:hypothetical protein, partial [Mycolicibacterium phlei]
MASFGGGGVIGFRDMLLAIRDRRPDVDLVAVVPQRGQVAQRCAADGITTKIAWTPWWAFGRWTRWRHLDPHALIGWLPYTVALL